MNISQAIQKLKTDLISWCTLNFKSKADASDVAAMQAKLDTLEVHPQDGYVYNLKSGVPTAVTVNSQGHVTNVAPVATISSVSSYTSLYSGPKLLSVVTTDTNGVESTKHIALPTFGEQFSDQKMLLSSKHYGTMPPANPTNGQLFFLKVEEE